MQLSVIYIIFKILIKFIGIIINLKVFRNYILLNDVWKNTVYWINFRRIII